MQQQWWSIIFSQWDNLKLAVRFQKYPYFIWIRNYFVRGGDKWSNFQIEFRKGYFFFLKFRVNMNTNILDFYYNFLMNDTV